MLRRVFASLCLVTGLFAAGCNTVHAARPIGEGASQVHLSVGGPYAGIGAPELLVPLTVVTYKRGITDRLDVWGGWHVLETFLNNGNLFVDLGASYYLLDQNGFVPGFTVAGQASPLVNLKSAWAFFDVQLIASWALDADDNHVIYTGFHNGLTPFDNGSDVVDVPVYTIAPFLGYQARFFGDGLGLNAEVKWLRPDASNVEGVVGYLGVGDQGALAFFVGVSGQFGVAP